VCTVNPVLGHEGEDEFKCFPTKKKKSVLVIGGGPAGIETALAASKRGHEVSIYEMKDHLGGQLLSAARDQRGGHRSRELIEYYEEQINRTDIEVHLGIAVDPKLIREVHPEVIVLAAGSKIERPKVPGVGAKNEYTVFDVMEGQKEPPGDRVAVIHGGKLGIVAALYLATIGKRVTLIHEGRRIYDKVISTWRWRYRTWLDEYNVQTMTETRVTGISEQSVTVLDVEGNENLLEVDSVVLAKRTANQELYDFVDLNSDEFFVVGDTIRPGYLITAIHGGYKLGCRI
jgi:2,4-dienoyl-CoA reductase (NADPH2)